MRRTILLVLILVGCGMPIPTQTTFDGYTLVGKWFDTEAEESFIFRNPRGLNRYGSGEFVDGNDTFIGLFDTRDGEHGLEILMFDFSIRTRRDLFPLAVEGQWLPFRILDDVLLLGRRELVRIG